MIETTVFSIKFESRKGQISKLNPNLSITKFDKNEMVTNVNEILKASSLEQIPGSQLVYSLKDGLLCIDGECRPLSSESALFLSLEM